jgi:hypothetical protein
MITMLETEWPGFSMMMGMKTIAIIFILSLFCLTGCKKETIEPDSTSPTGLLRVECDDCEVRYTVGDKEFTKEIEGQNSDISFPYKAGMRLVTQISSEHEQSIRVLVIDSNGNIVSNQLTFLNSGEVKRDSFSFQSF